MQNQPTSEEKFWAILSHLSALAPGMGMLIPAFGWVNHRKKSDYAAFQSLQALGYQSLGYTLWTLGALFVLIVLTVATLPLLKAGEGINLWISVHVLVMFLLYGVYLIFPILGAAQCGLGRDFRYPILGKRLARTIEYDPAADGDSALNEQREERFAASMSHFCIIFPLTGLLVPIVLWAAGRGPSRFMKFQSLQAIVFQAISSLVSIVLGGIALVIFGAIVISVVLAPSLNQPPIESLFGIFIFLICLAVMLLIIPLFQILGQWAGLRILQGHDYRYPILGRLLENWLAKREEKSA